MSEDLSPHVVFRLGLFKWNFNWYCVSSGFDALRLRCLRSMESTITSTNSDIMHRGSGLMVSGLTYCQDQIEYG